MLTHGKDYLYKIAEILEEVITSQEKNIRKAAEIFADTFEKGNSIYVFGNSHAGIISEELFYRTGGLAIINPIFNPTLMLNTRPVTMTTKAERIEGFAKEILAESPAIKGDVLLIHSVSGRNIVTIEMAMEARRRGIFVIALTNLNYSKNVASRHSSGKNLYEIADLVIDNCGDFEDGSIEIDGFRQKIGPSSTAIGAAIGNAIVVETTSILISRGVEPPIYHSANVDGGDEFNKNLIAKYKNRIHYLS